MNAAPLPRRARSAEVVPPIYAGLPRIFGAPWGDDLGLCRARDRRLRTVEAVAGIVGLLSPGALLVFPAGLLQVASETAALAAAEAMRRWSEEQGIALLFGIDIAPHEDDAGELVDAWGFACDAGVARLWPAKRVRPTRRDGPAPLPDEPRCFTLGGRRVALLVGSELFHPGLRQAIARARPELIVLLTHLGPNARWGGALAALAEVAPLLVAGELCAPLRGRGQPTAGRAALGCMPAWAAAPKGWSRAAVGSHGDVEIHAYQPLF